MPIFIHPSIRFGRIFRARFRVRGGHSKARATTTERPGAERPRRQYGGDGAAERIGCGERRCSAVCGSGWRPWVLGCLWSAVWSAVLLGCRIERVLPGQEDAGVSPLASQPSPPRYSTDEAPLTPFRSLLQGAWSPQLDERPRVVEPLRPPPLAGLQLLVVAPVAEAGRREVLNLCRALTGEMAAEPMRAVSQSLQRLECWLPVDLQGKREALLASAVGLWGAAVAVPLDHSAIAVAERAVDAGLGFVVWSTLPPLLDPEHLPIEPGHQHQGTLQCAGAPPLALAIGGEAALPALAAGETDAAVTERRALHVGAVDAGVDDDAGLPDAAIAGGTDAGVSPTEGVDEVPTLVFVGIRTAQGQLVAGVSGLSASGERVGSVGDVALPSRRLMVGGDGIVLLDPGQSRQVTPDPLAALRAYERVARGGRGDKDALALLPEGPKGEASGFVHYLHVPDRPGAGCEPGAVR